MALMMAMRLGVLNPKGRCKLCGAEREDIKHVMEECEDMEEAIRQKGEAEMYGAGEDEQRIMMSYLKKLNGKRI
jgi:hypothetical protein